MSKERICEDVDKIVNDFIKELLKMWSKKTVAIFLSEGAFPFDTYIDFFVDVNGKIDGKHVSTVQEFKNCIRKVLADTSKGKIEIYIGYCNCAAYLRNDLKWEIIVEQYNHHETDRSQTYDEFRLVKNPIGAEYWNRE